MRCCSTSRSPRNASRRGRSSRPPRPDADNSVEILLIAGSLQRESANKALLRVAQRCAGTDVDAIRVDTRWFETLGDIPPLNPDTAEPPPPAVAAFRAAVTHSDGVLIST